MTPKYLSVSDPASRWTAAQAGPASFAYCTNYLIDLEHAVIVDVEPSTAVRQGELAACRTMIERTDERLGLHPQRLTADTAYGSAELLEWLVHDQEIAPHIRVFDKSKREDGTFSRDDFAYDPTADLCRCPGGHELRRYRRAFSEPRTGPPADDTHRYRASKADCDACALKSQCCPKTPARKVTRSIHETARDVAREIAKTDAYWTSMRQRKKVEMLFAHLKRILKLDRLRLRGLLDLQLTGRVLAPKAQVPVLGERLGAREAIGLRRDTMIFSGEVGRALPLARILAAVDVHLAAENRVLESRFAHGS